MRRGSAAAMRREGGVVNLLSGGTMRITCAGGNCTTPLGVTPRATHNITIQWNTQKIDSESVNDDQSRFLTVPIIL
jgi:hypothetical protein